MLRLGLLSILLTAAPLALSQTLEQAEQELQAAQRRKAEQDAAARAAQARTAAANARQATLVLQANTDCQLKIDGQTIRMLAKDEATPIQVQAGEQLVECVATSDPDVRVREIKAISAGTKAVMMLELDMGRFVRVSDGMLKDAGTGLYWSQSDNGSDISKGGAEKYCASKGLSLPSADELLGIYDAESKGTACVSTTCKVSELFQLTSPEGWYWSGTTNDSNEAWLISLSAGSRVAGYVGFSNNLRALCVRRS